MIRIDDVYVDGKNRLWKIVECYGSVNQYWAKRMEDSENVGYYRLTDNRMFTREDLANMTRL